MTTGPRINAARLNETVAAIAEIGALPNGGSCRLALTRDDGSARDLFCAWAKACGCRILIDRFGNVFAVLDGREALPAVYMGSHLDTQPQGGRFDGIYGVLAGLEVIRSCVDAGYVPKRPLVAANWTNEEGVRFAPGLTGSKGFAGLLDPEVAAATTDGEGICFDRALAEIGYAGSDVPPPVAAYLEAHIEQGPILERAGVTIGVVQGVQGVRWFEVEFDGACRHAGTTPMDLRSDAMLSGARAIVDMRTAALTVHPDVRFTVGRLRLGPGSINTVPNDCMFTIDLRHPDMAVLDLVEQQIRDIAAEAAALEDCTAEVRRIFSLPPLSFDRNVVATVAGAAVDSGHSSVAIVSGAFHDACSLAQVAPSAMIFIPCRDGVSHDESEDADPAHVVAGADVLLRAAMKLGES